MNLDDLPAGYRIDPDGVARRGGPTSKEYVAAKAHSPGRVTAEKVWQARVIAYARQHGWRWFHTHDSRRSPAGFPDLVLVRDRVVYAELKTDTGRVSPAQQEWLDALTAAGAEVYVWRPSQDGDVQRVLA